MLRTGFIRVHHPLGGCVQRGEREGRWVKKEELESGNFEVISSVSAANGAEFFRILVRVYLS